MGSPSVVQGLNGPRRARPGKTGFGCILLSPILITSPAAIAVVPTPASSLVVLARRKTEGLIAQRETPSHVGVLHCFLLLGAIFSAGPLAAVGGAAIVAVDGPSVAAGASAKAVMPSGGRVVELALASFAAPSADRPRMRWPPDSSPSPLRRCS
jgi:hypothetical protein